MAPWHDTDFYTSGRASVAWTLATVAVVGIIGLPSLAAFAFARLRSARFLAADAKMAEAGIQSRALRPGHAVLRGEVVGAPDTEVLTIRIRQVGREYRVKQGVRHKWTEVSRHVEARPFSLRVPSGESVEVRPGQDVILVHQLFVVERGREEQRERVALLRTAERVYVEGRLMPPPRAGAYREGAATFTLGPMDGQPMLISVDALERRHQKRAAIHGRWGIGLLFAALFVNVALLGTFWAGSFAGQVASFRLTDERVWTTTSKGHTTTHFGVYADLGGETSPPSFEEVSWEAYSEAKQARAAGLQPRLPFVLLPWGLGEVIGDRPTLNGVAAVLAWVLLALAPLGYLARVHHLRPWYERPKVVDDGEGPLGGKDQLA